MANKFEDDLKKIQEELEVEDYVNSSHITTEEFYKIKEEFKKMRKLDIKIGDEVIIEKQRENERFLVGDIRENGYITLLNYTIFEDGLLSREHVRRVIIADDDVIGIQTTMRF